MDRKLLFIFLCCGLLKIKTAAAQQLMDTVYQLPVSEVTAQPIRQEPVGSEQQRWSHEDLEQLPIQNVADLLNLASGTFIKSYGQGSLATSSIRGGSAGHTLVLWNGLPVHSPMLGQLDLSLLPVSFADDIQFQKGGNTSLWGSGALGGTLSINNKPVDHHGMTFKNSSIVGHFGRYQQTNQLSLGTNKWQSVSRYQYLKAKNDFRYQPAPGLPKRRQTNAEIQQNTIQQSIYYKPSQRQSLAFHYWHQASERQIPPTTVQTRSEAFQEDLANRFLLSYKHLLGFTTWNFKSGFFEEHLNYFDDQIGLASPSRFQTFIGDFSGQWTWSEQLQLLVGGTYRYTKAWIDNYDRPPTEHQSAIFSSIRYQLHRWQGQLSIRQQRIDHRWAPTVPSFGFQYTINPHLYVKGKISRNYRLPTFNDRFWRPGGNESLKPEEGWSQEITIGAAARNQPYQWSISGTLYNRVINQWILWSKPENQSFWTAHNIAKVWSRGLEPMATLTYRNGDFYWQTQLGYDFTRSTNEVRVASPKINAGDQLLYTPVHQAISTLSLSWKSISLGYFHRYVGPSEGINEQIKGYQVGDARLMYAFNWGDYEGQAFLNAQNIWNTSYVVIERRPMPGIQLQGGITIQFSKNKK